VDFAAAKREGLAHTEELAKQYSDSLGLPREELITYMTENINYDMDEESLRGLNLYYRLAAECRLIETVKELVFAD
jgi:chorismate dehydratase